MPSEPPAGDRSVGGGAHERGASPSERVRRLEQTTIDRIAAGEVIPRPARVVAELVDNALDAGASRITVAVDGDGTERIRVADDGHGLSRADARLAVERHATSKLAPDGDPVGVDSLGFRGEALAAIADAGTLELTTADGDRVGTRIVVGSGDEPDPSVSDASRGRGTTVVVRDLFANRPARRESLAGTRAEFGRITVRVSDYALANPTVAFTLEHDGSRTLSTPGTGVTAALLGVYDRETASQSTTVDARVDTQSLGEQSDHRRSRGDRETSEDGAPTVRIVGTLAYPAITRASNDHVRISVNGRPIRDARLAGAVRAGYGRLLPDGREPVAAVNVRVPPARIDPNVHPAKREVGLRDAPAVTDAVESVVTDALTGADLRRRVDVATDLDTALKPVGEADGTPSAFVDATPIGTFADLYALVEAGDELLVLDTHAAHERVNYERLARALNDEAVSTATLDPPAIVSLSADEATAAATHATTLSRLGFETASFGGGTRRVSAVPAPFGRAVAPESIRDVLDELTDGRSPRDAREALLADLACHPSLKRGDAIDRDDVDALLDRLDECERPYACPHGRPTVVSMPAASLADAFDREW
jgi:DNA mismatch repair protein MutL